MSHTHSCNTLCLPSCGSKQPHSVPALDDSIAAFFSPRHEHETWRPELLYFLCRSSRIIHVAMCANEKVRVQNTLLVLLTLFLLYLPVCVLRRGAWHGHAMVPVRHRYVFRHDSRCNNRRIAPSSPFALRPSIFTLRPISVWPCAAISFTRE